jgi:hypothetical protein
MAILSHGAPHHRCRRMLRTRKPAFLALRLLATPPLELGHHTVAEKGAISRAIDSKGRIRNQEVKLHSRCGRSKPLLALPKMPGWDRPSATGNGCCVDRTRHARRTRAAFGQLLREVVQSLQQAAAVSCGSPQAYTRPACCAKSKDWLLEVRRAVSARHCAQTVRLTPQGNVTPSGESKLASVVPHPYRLPRICIADTRSIPAFCRRKSAALGFVHDDAPKQPHHLSGRRLPGACGCK